MPLEDIYALPVADLAADNAALWLWVTAGHNRAGVGMACAQAWGFSIVGEFVWAKPNYGMGAFPRPQHEILLVCRRGSVVFDRADVGSVQNWRQDYGFRQAAQREARRGVRPDRERQPRPLCGAVLPPSRTRLGFRGAGVTSVRR
jgi:hypothetical protein